MPRSFGFAPDKEAFWSRARSVELNGGVIKAIAPQDLLLYLCVHGAKHGWTTLGSVCDVAETVRANNSLDLVATVREGSRLGSRRMLLTGLLLAYAMLQAPVSPEVIAIARGDRFVISLVRSIERALLHTSKTGRGDFDPWIVPLRSIEDARGRIRYVVRRLLAPTMGEFELIALPRSLFALYWVIRPFRMAVQYGPRLLRPSSARTGAQSQ
jgi:hypothetical protein